MEVFSNYTLSELENLFISWEEKRHAVSVVGKRVYQEFLDTPFESRQLRKSLQERLKREFFLPKLEVAAEQCAADGTRKFLFALADGHHIETVLIPDVGRKKGKRTLCVSSQVGCAMACTFCLTGQSGLARNLQAWEIVEQYRAVAQITGEAITHLVFMGMGEPLHNLAELKKALEILTSPRGANIPPSRITVSTSGLLPQIEELMTQFEVRLAVTLTAADDKTRTQLMPINRRYPLAVLLEGMRNLKLKGKNKIFIEYVLLKDVNDRDADAKALAQHLSGIPCKVNLIPFNEIPGVSFQRPSEERIYRFLRLLRLAKLSVSIRQPRGKEIMAACGQLREASKGSGLQSAV